MLTIKYLGQYTRVKKRLKTLDSKISDIESITWSSSVQTSAPYPSYTKTYTKVPGSPAEQRRKLIDLRAQRRRLQRIAKKIEKFINSIPDELMKELFRRKFIDGEPWVIIADEMGYAGHSGVHKKFAEYLKDLAIEREKFDVKKSDTVTN